MPLHPLSLTQVGAEMRSDFGIPGPTTVFPECHSRAEVLPLCSPAPSPAILVVAIEAVTANLPFCTADR